MPFYSILFPNKEKEVLCNKTMPECLSDLHLDQFFGFIFEAKKRYALQEFYFTMLKDKETITYRQDVLRDLYHEETRNVLGVFSERTGVLKRNMDDLRKALKLKPGEQNNYLTKGTLLEKASIYTSAIEELYQNLDSLPLESKGLLDFKAYIYEYCNSDAFKKLQTEVHSLRKKMDDIHYVLYIKGGVLRLAKYQEEESLTDEIVKIFERFRKASTKSYAQKLSQAPEEKRIEVEIISLVSKLYPQEFKELEAFAKANQNFDNDVLLRFSREIQFYIAWLEETYILRGDRLSFTIPEITETHDELILNDLYDMMLATKSPASIVTNTITTKDPEHILVITGPNQGGKSTFARAFAQIHYLAALGLDVPASKAKVLLADNVLTHFEKEESIQTLNGKLQEELERLYKLKQQATDKSIIIINEIFASTTAKDAVVLGCHMMDWLASLGGYSIVVTFLDELTKHGPETVSLMTTIESENDHRRTFQIFRRGADGKAYAMDIQEKYSLTSKDLERRLNKNES